MHCHSLCLTGQAMPVNECFTNDMKEKARELKKSGLGYSKIAKALSVNINTVASYFKRLKKMTETNVEQKVEITTVPKSFRLLYRKDNSYADEAEFNDDAWRKQHRIEVTSGRVPPLNIIRVCEIKFNFCVFVLICRIIIN